MSIAWHDAFDFRHRDHRQEPTEQEEQSREQAEATNQHPDVHPRRDEVGPTGRQEVATQRRDRDHKTLEPHSDVHEDTNDHHEPSRRSAPLEPEQLWDHNVTGNHDPIGP